MQQRIGNDDASPRAAASPRSPKCTECDRRFDALSCAPLPPGAAVHDSCRKCAECGGHHGRFGEALPRGADRHERCRRCVSCGEQYDAAGEPLAPGAAAHSGCGPAATPADPHYRLTQPGRAFRMHFGDQTLGQLLLALEANQGSHARTLAALRETAGLATADPVVVEQHKGLAEAFDQYIEMVEGLGFLRAKVAAGQPPASPRRPESPGPWRGNAGIPWRAPDAPRRGRARTRSGSPARAGRRPEE